MNLKYKDAKSVAEHLSNFQGLFNKLSTMKLALDDEGQTLLLLNSLPGSWETLAVSLSNSTLHGVIIINMVKDNMFNQKARRKKLGISSNTEALVIERWRRSKSRKPFNDYNHDKSRGNSKFIKEIKCFYCSKIGHIKKECKKFKKEQFKGKCEENKEDKDITIVASDGDTIIVCDDMCVNLACQDSTWVVDTTTLFHITARRDFFSSYTSDSFGWFRMRNETKCEIVRIGDVELETSIGCKLVLKNVKHVPEMRFSLISIGKLNDEGYHSHLGEGKWKLTKGSFVLARGKKNNTFYKTEARLVKEEVNIVDNEASIELWHK